MESSGNTLWTVKMYAWLYKAWPSWDSTRNIGEVDSYLAASVDTENLGEASLITDCYKPPIVNYVVTIVKVRWAAWYMWNLFQWVPGCVLREDLIFLFFALLFSELGTAPWYIKRTITCYGFLIYESCSPKTKVLNYRRLWVVYKYIFKGA